MFGGATLARDPITICIYGEPRGSSAAHRALLRDAKKHAPRLFLIAGNVLDHRNGIAGRPDAVLNDYRTVFSSPENPLKLWPFTPGPALFATPGGFDEQYYLPKDVAASADSLMAGRTAYEGTWEYGVRLYDSFYLEQMRLRVQPLTKHSQPLPRSPYGDYLLVIGTGSKKDLAVISIYRTDRWSFKTGQISWLDSTLAFFRAEAPSIPLLAISHDQLWYLPDTLDDGSHVGLGAGVREGQPESDLALRRQVCRMFQEYRVDLAIAAGSGEYRAASNDGLLRINAGAVLCEDASGARIAQDNLWIEYTQNDTTLQVTAHPLEGSMGCGLRPEAAAAGITFEKHRAPNSIWRVLTP